MENTFSPTNVVLSLFYDLIISNAKSAEKILSSHNHLLDKELLEEVKNFVASYIVLFAFQEKDVKTEEMAFIHEITNDDCKHDIERALDSVDDSCFTQLMDCFCLADVYQQKEEKSMALDLFNFAEEVGQAFLSSFATPNRIIFYNSFMEHMQKHAKAKDQRLSDRIEFQKVNFEKPQMDYSEMIATAKENIWREKNDKSFQAWLSDDLSVN